MSERTYDLPGKFYADHRARDLPEEGTSVELEELSRGRVRVRMDGPAYADLLSDADYYSTPGMGFEPELFGLISSARATARALRKAGPPTNG